MPEKSILVSPTAQYAWKPNYSAPIECQDSVWDIQACVGPPERWFSLLENKFFKGTESQAKAEAKRLRRVYNKENPWTLAYKTEVVLQYVPEQYKKDQRWEPQYIKNN